MAEYNHDDQIKTDPRVNEMKDAVDNSQQLQTLVSKSGTY